MHILFVCTGNTCRSPMAEGLCRHFAQKYNLPLTCTSAGLFASPNAPASPYAIETMSNRGIDINAHRARQADEKLLKEADLVLAMTPGHVEALISRYPGYKEKFRTFTAPVNDPFGGSLASYERTAQQLENLIKDYLEKLNNR